MARRTLIPTASLVAVIAALGFVTTDRALAAEGMQVISSDLTAHFMSLGMNKSAVINLPTDMKDIKDVVVADPSIVIAVVKSNRRVFLIGHGHGETNVYFFDADGQEIGALAVTVASTQMNASMPSTFEYDAFPANEVVVIRGTESKLYSCTPKTCISSLSHEEEEEAKTTRDIGTPLINNNNGGK